MTVSNFGNLTSQKKSLAERLLAGWPPKCRDRPNVWERVPAAFGLQELSCNPIRSNKNTELLRFSERLGAPVLRAVEWAPFRKDTLNSFAFGQGPLHP